MGKYTAISFGWAMFKWLGSRGQDCGYATIPYFGRRAHSLKFYLDFSAIYVGVGMVFIPIAMILGDGLYNFLKVVYRYQQDRKKNGPFLPIASVSPIPDQASVDTQCFGRSFDDQRRTELFLKDGIRTWFAIAGYVAIAATSAGILPQIFPQLKWYHIFVLYTVAPPFAFCNAYGCGLTDWSLASTYGKLVIFIIGAWAGQAHGGVVAGLVACG
ncbi:hypothetical protein CRG98_041624, partial [Punica granatum]